MKEELLFKHAKHKDWEISHNFDNCKLNRKAYGAFLSDYITGAQDGFVLNLNGSWGAGKTEFLKRLYTDFLTKKHPCIYIDAWESDFSKNPLTVVTSELLSQIEAFNKNIADEETLKKVKKYLVRGLKGVAVGVAGFVTKQCIDDAGTGAAAMQQLLTNDNDSSVKYIDSLTKDHMWQAEAIKKTRENLTLLAKVLEEKYSAKLPIIVLVDELDRCRPTYAIEMLEVIKHFFKTDKFVFVIATDTDQLSHSIKAIYGSEFDSKQYLKRFFDCKATLPTPDIEAYLNAKGIDYTQYNNLKLFPTMYNHLLPQSINKTISLLSRAYDLHIRDIDQLMNKFESCLRSAQRAFETTGKEQVINFPALLIGLIEYEKSQPAYEQRTKYKSPLPVIKHGDHKISKDFTLLEFIKKSMLHITFSEVQETDSRGRKYTIDSLPNPNELRNQLDQTNSLEYQAFIDNTATCISGATSKPSLRKFWDWDDFKRVIELSGTLA